MLLREALELARTPPSSTLRVALVCSFEPLHLASYLRAHLAERFGKEPPAVLTFPYDSLETALRVTGRELRHDPAIACLGWNDLHPGLSWRSRGPLDPIPLDELDDHGSRLRQRLKAWIAARGDAETYVVEPPLAWLPALEPQPSGALGPLATHARSILTDIIDAIAQQGGRTVRISEIGLELRELLRSGCPLSVTDSDRLARDLVQLGWPRDARRKVLVVDLDGTLWDGVIGEDGRHAIAYGAEGRGYPYHVFQLLLKRLRSEGVILALASKNNPTDVEPIFDELEMPLRLEDFAIVRCNWRSKSENLREIAAALNVLPEALVLVDDNEAELSAVRATLPEVACLRVPGDGAWETLFGELQRLFATWRVSEEDRIRSRMPVPVTADVADATEAAAGSGLEHLQAMAMRVEFDDHAFDDSRSLELLNKTNQFNLTGERIATADWLAWRERPDTFCVSARLRDRFGDFGTIAVVTGVRADAADVRNMALSCRAFGRGVEFVMLHHVVEHLGATAVRGSYRDTAKNTPALEFLKALGAGPGAEGEWRVEGSRLQELSDRVLVETTAAVAVT